MTEQPVRTASDFSPDDFANLLACGMCGLPTLAPKSWLSDHPTRTAFHQACLDRIAEIEAPDADEEAV
jgi:hypothetical protein